MKLIGTLGLAVAIFFASLASLPAFAHLGGGSPFVLLNQEYAQANPLTGLDPDISLDAPPSVYTVGQPINFSIDRNIFGSPDLQFRWIWDKGGQPELGDNLNHTYNQVGMHRLTLDIKNDPTTDFSLIDSINVPVTPTSGYKLPTTKVAIRNSKQNAKGFVATFEAVAEADKSSKITKYQWKFGDGQSAEGQVVTHQFEGKEFRLFPMLHLEDSNGLTADAAFEVDNGNNALQSFDIQGLTVLVSPTSSHRDRPKPVWLIAAVVVGGGILFGFLELAKRS
ncbi:MAG TPA: PKD domain-containing protein [Candidatus Nanoarchaeia archaeon]|nr:PKD domain-containing protein [Candidatus Nanoarchaeia archaeon]